MIQDVLNVIHLSILFIISVNKDKVILHSSCETGIWIYPSICSKILQLVLFLRVFQTKPSMDFFCLRPSHSPCLVHPNKISQEYRSWSCSLHCFLHSPDTSSLLGPVIPSQNPVLKHPHPIQFSACFSQLQLFICNVWSYSAIHV